MGIIILFHKKKGGCGRVESKFDLFHHKDIDGFTGS